MKIQEGFRRLANASINMMERARIHPRGAVRALVPALDRMVSESADALALLLLEGPEYPRLQERYTKLATQANRMAQALGLAEDGGPMMFPALGIGDDLNPQSGGGALPDTGVEPLPDMVPAGGVGPDHGPAAEQALKARSVNRFVDQLLGENSEKPVCPNCGGKTGAKGECTEGCH